MSKEFQSSKFRYLNDPPVATRPFSISVDPDKCIGCGVCIKQCPCQTIEMVQRKEPSSFQVPACQYRCPAGTDIRAYLGMLSKGGSLEEAWRIITETNPFPAVTGRVCPHPCEAGCNREGVDDALNIHGMERTIGDYGIEKGLAFTKPEKARKEKVAVIGSGPSGLSCAYQLARLGYGVTVFEADPKPGGMLTYAIPRYRLPEAVVDAEIKRIVDLGVTLKLGVTAGKDISLDNLKKEFKAVYVAPGAQGSTALGIEGEGENLYTGLAFLRSVKEKKPLALGKKVIVIGGGNTALDAARTARRMGSDVTILYRRTASEMPAHREEVDAAVAEGVKIDFLCAPVAAAKNGKGRLTCRKMELGPADASGRPAPVPIKGSEFDVPFDTVIAAVGQDLRAEGFESLTGSPWLAADALGVTKEKGVFAGGDAATGPGMVSEAVGAGWKAALAIDAFISGKKAELPVKKLIDYSGVPLNDRKKISRTSAAELGVDQRLKETDAEVNLALDSGQVSAESKRCLGCGLQEPKFTGMQYFGKICIACHNCEAVCPQEALKFPSFYQVNKGRWAYDFDYPEAPGLGMPNPLMLEKPAPFAEIEHQLTDVEKVIYRRRSVRVYRKDPVPRELISRVLEAGRFAPSAGNCQGWKFIVVTDRQLLDELSASTIKFLSLFTKLYQGKGPGRTTLKKALAFLKPNAIDQRPMCAIQALSTPKFGDGKLDCFFNAPAAILLVTHHLHISEPQLGMGICGQNMVLAAHSLGLGTCYVGFVSNALNLDPVTKKKFRKKLGIEWPYDSVATVLTIGYPAVPLDKPVDREFPRIKWVE
jgi:NADPH-dependent glutamate synthase beta subunit-like oxidoreductase/nitroreductase/Pyruvate/2-oxoacid:ferredoxin oxidoreductase delta subunit